MDLFETLLHSNMAYELYEAPNSINRFIKVILNLRKEWFDLLNTICDTRDKDYHFSFSFINLTSHYITNNTDIVLDNLDEALITFKSWIINKLQFEIFSDDEIDVGIMLSNNMNEYNKPFLNDAIYGNAVKLSPTFICFEWIRNESPKEFISKVLNSPEHTGIKLPELIPFINDEGLLDKVYDKFILDHEDIFYYTPRTLNRFCKEISRRIYVMKEIVQKYNYIKQHQITLFKKYIEQNPDLDPEFIGENII